MKRKTSRLRLFVQALWTALSNGYVYGWTEGRIYTGQVKKLCVPGLNCYSCPGALASCPIGALQSVLDSPRFNASCYVFGLLLIFGSVLGRFVCGWLCPFGLVQDLTYRIPVGKKCKNFPGHRYLTKLKYIILLVFVILLPVLVKNIVGAGQPWFCEYICPSGTLMAGVPLTAADPLLRQAVGWRFAWKAALLVGILLLSVKWYRPFCKYVCPLGAFYSAFNGFSLLRYRVDNEKCISCGKCREVCKMDIDVPRTPNHPECIRCGDCRRVCPTGAICRGKIRNSKDTRERS